MRKEAILYEKLPNKKVRCTACARYCEMADGQVGLCGIRGNENGKLDLSFIIIPVQRYFPLQPQDVTGFVNIARITILVKEER